MEMVDLTAVGFYDAVKEENITCLALCGMW